MAFGAYIPIEIFPKIVPKWRRNRHLQLGCLTVRMIDLDGTRGIFSLFLPSFFGF